MAFSFKVSVSGTAITSHGVRIKSRGFARVENPKDNNEAYESSDVVNFYVPNAMAPSFYPGQSLTIIVEDPN